MLAGVSEASRLRARLLDHHRSIKNDLAIDRLELYHRASSGVRVARGRRRSQLEFVTGREDGVAVRVGGPDPGAFRFAACSGGGLGALRWAAREARASAGLVPGESCFVDGPEDSRIDLDEVGPLPSEADLSGWLDEAWLRVSSAGQDAGGLVPAVAWVEASATVETLAADPGRAASRGRTRAWAMVRLRQPTGGAPFASPLFVAGRGWADLPADGWAGLLAARNGFPGTPADRIERDLPLVFASEAAAPLVIALVRELHGERGGLGAPVGPGWVVEDDPASLESLSGGRFDDAGFPSSRRLLADGVAIRGSLEGAGAYRRASFRDPPAPAPSHLVVGPPEERLPESHFFVNRLVLSRFGPRLWQLELEGVVRRSAGSAFPARARMRVAPRDLVKACRGGHGLSRRLHLGVRTPDLVFDPPKTG